MNRTILCPKVFVLVCLPIFNSKGKLVHASKVYKFPDLQTADYFASMFKYVPEYYIRIISDCSIHGSDFKGFRYPDGSFVDPNGLFRYAL